jgi:hydrogenase maturation factor
MLDRGEATSSIIVVKMITYPDGTEARVGDEVLLEPGAHTGLVLAVIDSAEARERENLEDQDSGLMIEASHTGTTFYPEHCFKEEVRFVSRRVA